MSTITNPFDLLPPRARLYAYTGAATALTALTIWLAAEGDVLAALVTFLTAITSTQSATKVDLPVVDVDAGIDAGDDDLEIGNSDDDLDFEKRPGDYFSPEDWDALQAAVATTVTRGLSDREANLRAQAGE